MTDQKPGAAGPADRPYMALVEGVEALFAEHGDTHVGLGYPKADGFHDRYRTFLDVTRFGPDAGKGGTLLDVGCATGCVLDEIKASGRSDIQYRGVDLSPVMIDKAREKHPEADFILGDPFELTNIWSDEPDYVLLCGLFTWRRDMSNAEMTAYMAKFLRIAFDSCKRGVAFNVMSHHVDWQRDDLFHVPFDVMAAHLKAELSRNYIFRADYGLFEYTTYLYK